MYTFSLLLCIYMGVKLLRYTVTVFFEELLICFPKWLHVLIFHQQGMRVSNSPHSHWHLPDFSIVAILFGVKFYLILIFIFIFLMTNDVGQLFCIIDSSSFSHCLIWLSFKHFFILNSSIVNIHCYITFSCMIEWFNNSVHHLGCLFIVEL